MALAMALLTLLVLALLGVIPAWPLRRGQGYVPGGVAGLLVVGLVVMLVTGNI